MVDKLSKSITKSVSQDKKRLGFWLYVFLIFMGIISLGFLDSAISFFFYKIQVIGKLMFLFDLLFVCLGVYTIYSFVKLKSNAVFLGKMYLITLFVSLFIIFLSSILTSSTKILTGQTSLKEGISILLSALIFFIVWMLYFTYSRKINTLFPKQSRKINRIDIILFVITLLFVFIISIVPSLVINYASSSLLEEIEYTDGNIFFTKPSDLDIKKIDDGGFSLSKENMVFINIYQGNLFKYRDNLILTPELSDEDKETLISFVFDSHFNESVFLYRHVNYEITDYNKGETSLGLKYMTRAVYANISEDIIDITMIVYDDASSKGVWIKCVCLTDKMEESENYLREVINSIRFI
jgi:hypothetical protein